MRQDTLIIYQTKLPKGFSSFPSNNLRCIYEISVVNHPVPVRIRSDIRKFIRIGAVEFMKHYFESLLPVCQCYPTSKFGSMKPDDTIYNNEFNLILFYRFTKVLYYHLEMACVVYFADVYSSEDF